MKILLPARPDSTAWTFAAELCRGLERDGVQVMLVAMTGPLAEHQRVALHALRNVELFESTYTAAEGDRIGEWLLELAREYDVDLVHLNDTAHRTLPWPAPVLITVHGSACARTVLQTGAARDTYVIPYGRSADGFSPLAKESIIAGVAQDVSAISEAASHTAWPTYVLDTVAERLPNLHYLGTLSQPDAAAVLSRTSIFIGEAAGYRVLEAALCACSLVLSDQQELRELWESAATFVAAGDAPALASALERLVEDSACRLELGAHARERALTLTAEKMAASYLSLYIEATLGASRALRERLRSSAALDRSA